MEESGEHSADIQAGMLMKVLKSSPFSHRQSAILGPGYYKDFPETPALLINESDFNYYAEQMLTHNLRMNRLRTESNGDILYQLEKGNVLIPTA